MKESADRPGINLDGVFYLEKVQTSERAIEGTMNGIVTSTEMEESAWTPVDCREDMEAKMNLISIGMPQIGNKSDSITQTSAVQVEEVTVNLSFFLCLNFF